MIPSQKKLSNSVNDINVDTATPALPQVLPRRVISLYIVSATELEATNLGV